MKPKTPMSPYFISPEEGEKLRQKALAGIKAVEQVRNRLASGLGIEKDALAVSGLKLAQGETFEAILALFGAVDCGSVDVYFIREEFVSSGAVGKFFHHVADFDARIGGGDEPFLKYKMYCEKGEIQ